MAEIRIGTCSWADEALSKHWYPPGVKAGERLPYYAEHFDTVEVDSTYYRLPDEGMVERWAARTPEEFVMHVKAFGLMTRHPVKLESLPPDLRDEASVDERGRVERPSREFRGKVIRRFLDAMGAFPVIWGLLQGGPGTATETVGIYIYITTWQDFNVSLGAAQSYITMVMMVVIVLAAIRLLRREKHSLDTMYTKPREAGKPA